MLLFVKWCHYYRKYKWLTQALLIHMGMLSFIKQVRPATCPHIPNSFHMCSNSYYSSQFQLKYFWFHEDNCDTPADSDGFFLLPHSTFFLLLSRINGFGIRFGLGSAWLFNIGVILTSKLTIVTTCKSVFSLV